MGVRKEPVRADMRATRQPKRYEHRKTDEKTLASVNADIVTLFNSTLHMLEQTIISAKINPAQGILGMMMVADLLHGGAYTEPNNDRPFLVGNKSKYYAGINMPANEAFPIAGFNWLDPIGSIMSIINAADENAVGALTTAEVYLNANVPHKFPKLLSDEAYAKILVSGSYIIHNIITAEAYQNLHTFVEASAVPVKTAAEALAETAQSVKSLAPLLSTLS